MPDQELEESRGARSTSIRRRYRHAYLLAALLLTITLPPFLGERMLGVTLVELFLLVTVLVGVYTSTEDNGRIGLSVFLGLSAVASRIAFEVLEQRAFLYAFLVSSLFFFAIVAWTLVSRLFSQRRGVTWDTLCGAFSVYLILGLLWTCAYVLLELVEPGSFDFGQVDSSPEGLFERFIGFSYTTLTTLGYGNVTPTNPRGDALTTLEAIVGQGYLAIVIARLVALQIAESETVE